MKKLVTFLLTAAIAIGVCGMLAACAEGDNDTNDKTNDITGTTGDETITITCLGADAKPVQKEVPLNPQRVAILDYAVLDMMDLYGVGDRVVSSARGTLAYLQTYWDKMDNGDIVDLGNLQSYDMEKLMFSEPDIIFIGGRQSGKYTEIEEIAPVVYLSVTAGNIVEETLANADIVAQIFNISEEKVQEVEEAMNIQSRVDALRAYSYADDNTQATKKALVLMYTSESSISALASDGRCSLISSELGFDLQAATATEGSGGNHGSSVSFETIAQVNPDYIFVLNRGYITSNGSDGNDSVRTVLSNSVVNQTTAAKNNNVIVMDNPDAWYTAEGGLQALDTMISDLEKAFNITNS